MKTAELLLILTGLCLQAVLLVIMVRRGSLKRFRWFYAYVLVSLLSTAADFATSGNEKLYFYVYWVSEILLFFPLFLALNEVFRSVFRTFYVMRWFRMLFPGIGLLMLFVSAVRAKLVATPDHDPLTVMIITLEISLQFLEIGIFSLFILLVRFFHLRWRQHEFGIAFGFGLSAAGSLVAWVLRSEIGTKFDSLVRIIPPIAYTLAVLVWLLTFMLRQPLQPPPGKASVLTPEEMVAELRRYTGTVKEILKR